MRPLSFRYIQKILSRDSPKGVTVTLLPSRGCKIHIWSEKSTLKLDIGRQGNLWKEDSVTPEGENEAILGFFFDAMGVIWSLFHTYQEWIGFKIVQTSWRDKAGCTFGGWLCLPLWNYGGLSRLETNGTTAKGGLHQDTLTHTWEPHYIISQASCQRFSKGL